MFIIKADKLRAFVRDVFIAAGCSKPEAERIGMYLVAANLTGHDSHGVVRVPRYLQRMRDGFIVADQEPLVSKETPIMAVVDARNGFGQTAAPVAVALGIKKCKAMGLAAIALRNAGHIGRVGDWAEMAAAEGLVSMHFVNASGSVLVAPYGGVERRFSTAPYCVGVPRPGMEPLVLDFATSIVAEGKVLVASLGGKKIPDDALVGADGRTSSDPHLLYGDYEPSGPRNPAQGSGAIRAFGDHKGSGLAFMCELLGGALTGTGATQAGRPFANGMLSFYIDPGRIDTDDFFSKDVARFVAYVKSAKPLTPGQAVLVPGEPEQRMRKQRLAEGVPLPENTWNAIKSAAREVGIDDAGIAAAEA
jgi:uncharacterized oxidoreductase